MDTYSRSNILAPRSQEDLQMEDLQGAASVVERDADQGSRLSTSAVQPVVASIMDAARPLPSGTHLTENSVEQPGAEQGITCDPSKLRTLDECKSWCDSWTEASPPLKRISEAIAALQEPSSRKRTAKLQSMCKLWDVQQYHAQRKRQLPEIENDFERKILKETRRLGELHDLHGQFSSVAVAMQRA